MVSMRRPWLAAVLSLVCSAGIGQLYNGRASKAALFVLGLPVAACLLLWSATALPLAPLNVLLPFLAILGLQVASGTDAFLEARRLRDVPRPWYARWYACLALWFLNAALVTPSTMALLRTSLVRGFSVAGRSMEPTLPAGDRVLVDLWGFGARAPGEASTSFAPKALERGDLVAFLLPEGRIRIKRIVALPGESVAVHEGRVSIDGDLLAEPYLRPPAASETAAGRDWGPEVVPDAHVFVLGDDRDHSFDSRHHGFIARSDVLGVARVVYFSWDAAHGRVRWERIGLRLR